MGTEVCRFLCRVFNALLTIHSEFTCVGNMANLSLNASAHNLTMPILAIFGSDDEVKYCQDAMIERFTGSKKVTRHEVQGGKHMPHVDYPEEYFSKLPR